MPEQQTQLTDKEAVCQLLRIAYNMALGGGYDDAAVLSYAAARILELPKSVQPMEIPLKRVVDAIVNWDGNR